VFEKEFKIRKEKNQKRAERMVAVTPVANIPRLAVL
jgi:hypothetical protein